MTTCTVLCVILLCSDLCDVGIDALIPVDKACDINLVANFQFTNGLIDIGVGAGQINFDAEVIVVAILGNGDINVVTGLAVLIFDGFNGHVLEDGSHGNGGQNAHSKDEMGMGEELPIAQSKLENQLAVKSSQ